MQEESPPSSTSHSNRWYTSPRVFALAFFLIFAAVIAVVFYFLGDYLLDALVWFSNFIKDLGVGGGFLLGGVFVLTAFPPLFGHGTLLYLAGFIYGIPLAFAIAYTGTVIGAIISFLLGRWILHSYYKPWLLKVQHYRAFERVINERGFLWSLLIRIAPYPFGITNIVLASTSLSFVKYLLASCIGLLKVLVNITIGSFFRDITEANTKDPARIIVAVVGIVLAIAVLAACWFAVQKKLKEVERVDLEFIPVDMEDDWEGERVGWWPKSKKPFIIPEITISRSTSLAQSVTIREEDECAIVDVDLDRDYD